MKLEKNIMKHIIVLVAILGGLFVGVFWSLDDKVTLGEASCGAILTMILILVVCIWFKLNQIQCTESEGSR